MGYGPTTRKALGAGMSRPAVVHINRREQAGLVIAARKKTAAETAADITTPGPPDGGLFDNGLLDFDSLSNKDFMRTMKAFLRTPDEPLFVEDGLLIDDRRHQPMDGWRQTTSLPPFTISPYMNIP